ncbi:Uncharacterised protein [Serratia odorifera]|uniref:Lactoylglutathione lyase n=1 Tax=Serratia odorifera TaxID=618 RepID=A0A3S4HRQ8_SEROD|nr:hypothetical protein [Serratia odorifera]VDZ60492.1 Uncharacterised protein [Serratia odorifera]
MELKIERVIETALYVSDMARASQFYETVLLLPAMVAKARFRAYDVGGQGRTCCCYLSKAMRWRFA